MGVVIFVLMIAIAFIGYVLHGGGGGQIFVFYDNGIIRSEYGITRIVHISSVI